MDLYHERRRVEQEGGTGCRAGPQAPEGTGSQRDAVPAAGHLQPSTVAAASPPPLAHARAERAIFLSSNSPLPETFLRHEPVRYLRGEVLSENSVRK